MNNFRKLTVAAIIALAASTGSTFAQHSSINPFSVDPATVNAWAQIDVGSSTTASARINLSSLSIADQFSLPSQDASSLDTLYKIVSVEGAAGLTVSLDNSNFAYCTELVNGPDGQQIRFNFLIENNQNINYGANVVKVTLQNTKTLEQTSVILMVTVK